jgi:hypothetical protein
MKLAVLLLGASLAGPVVAADELPIDRGATIRPAQVLDFPDRSGKLLGTLPPGAPVDIYERQRLWLRTKPPAGLAAPAGWVQLTDLRLGFTAPPPATANAPVPAPAPAPTGGAFSAFSRSVSGLLAGFQSRQSGYASGSNATIGIRGLTSGELNASQPNYQALAEIERYAVMPAQAQMFANAGGLMPQRIMYVTAPPMAAPQPPIGGPR